MNKEPLSGKLGYLLLSKVATLVVPHVSLGAEALSTVLWARKRPFIFVNSNVNLQVLLLTEGLVAPWKWALERLSPVM